MGDLIASNFEVVADIETWAAEDGLAGKSCARENRLSAYALYHPFQLYNQSCYDISLDHTFIENVPGLQHSPNPISGKWLLKLTQVSHFVVIPSAMQGR